MLNVALTGNVASGKSMVADLFQRWGGTVIDADAIVRELQRPGQPLLAEMAEEFGSDILQADGSLDRAAMRQRMVADPTVRRRLNQLVHPAVQARRDLLARQAADRGAELVVSVIPLLYETGSAAEFDAVILVDAPEPLRRQRLLQYRGLAPGEADGLIAAQDPSGPKRELADYVIDNAGTREELERSAGQVWRLLEARGDGRSA